MTTPTTRLAEIAERQNYSSFYDDEDAPLLPPRETRGEKYHWIMDRHGKLTPALWAHGRFHRCGIGGDGLDPDPSENPRDGGWAWHSVATPPDDPEAQAQLTAAQELAQAHVPTHAMRTAGARAIGNTLRWTNHYERADEVWRAMLAAQADPENLPAIPSAAYPGPESPAQERERMDAEIMRAGSAALSWAAIQFDPNLTKQVCALCHSWVWDDSDETIKPIQHKPDCLITRLRSASSETVKEPKDG